ncbi:serine protease inhibitor Kazal-type 1 [Drosophila tropicalis]|uniref:serine protease inhibitor Kazal-type 1 n=1 Tax=Drosophila tropicalis TaxID=46794 RepID=UPI0035ABB9F1
MKLLHLLMALCLLVALLFMAPAQADNDEDNIVAKIPKKICPCPRNFDPVCASNLITYPNRCEYDCVRREVERAGRSLNLLRTGSC